MNIRLLLADAQHLFRECLRDALGRHADFEVVAECADGDGLIAALDEHAVDVLILDPCLPGPCGMALIKQLKSERPELPMLVLSTREEDQFAVRAVRAGARGFISKRSGLGELISGIRSLASGRAFISARVAEQLVAPAAGAPHSLLSNREDQILLMLASGISPSHIAAKLRLSRKTVSTHKTRIMEKLGLGTTLDLMRYAVTHRVAGPESTSGPAAGLGWDTPGRCPLAPALIDDSPG